MSSEKITFSLMQYNMLGLCYAIPEWFPHCEPSILHHERRRGSIVQQFKKLDPDFITVQELDCIDYFRGELSKVGYESVYKQRPYKNDGCGIFYKSERFQVCQTHSLEYNDGSRRVGLLATFSIKVNPTNVNDEQLPCVCIGTTHLYWDDQYMDVLTAEAQVFLSHLDSFNKHGLDQRLPTIVAGDFNSTPSSPVYAAMKNHSLKFHSAYKNYKNADHEPPTCHKLKDHHAIDYIFYSTAHTICDLKLVSVEDLVDLKTCSIPSADYPSDHLPLKANFELIL